jgi:hypothetical protein
MYKTLILILLSLTIMAGLRSQTPDTIKTRYGVEVNQFVTGSGFGSGTEFHLIILPNQNKNLSLGIYFSPDEKKITGITLNHELALTRNNKPRKAVPYAFYHMIYRFTRVKETQEGQHTEIASGLYKSFEHHIGLGFRIAVSKGIYCNSSLGYGVFLGSIKKQSEIVPVNGEIKGINGFGVIAKAGVAFVF